MAQAWEVELKLAVDNVLELHGKLAERGYQEAGQEQHGDTYFRHPSRDFRQTDEAFRLRRVNDSACVTYKGPRRQGPVKTRPEIELSIDPSEIEQWHSMLCALSFEPLPTVSKVRQVYRHPSHEIVVVIDEVEQLGVFAELELVVESESDLELAQTKIQELAAALGLGQVVTRSYLGQLLEKLDLE